METIAWIGFSQGLFAAILMMTKKKRSASDKILTAWLTLLSFEFITCAIDYRLFGNPLLSSSFLLFNPAFYLYVKSLTKSSFSLKWKQLFHLFPFIFFEISAYLFKEPYSLKSFFEEDGTLWFRYLFGFASMLSWILYNTSSAILVLKHRRRLENEFSTIESDKRLNWLLFIVIFYNLFCILSVTIALLVIFMKIKFPLSPVYNYSALLGLVYILGFYGLRQRIIYQENVFEKTSDRYRKYKLQNTKKEKIKQQLIKYFEEEKAFLNPEINMSTLSHHLNIPKHQITEVLNMELGKNFFRFVNEYRVEAVKKKLHEKSKIYSIEAIGYECGFSSKSSFFTVFKKITGKTPMHFKSS